MATLAGRNIGDTISGTSEDDVIFGGDSLNDRPDFGPVSDADVLIGGESNDLDV
jgi:hypothetical protein